MNTVTANKLENSVFDTRSIFIPHVFADISKETVVEILQEHYNLGTIAKIECIPKVNQTDGHDYYSCYVFFRFWKNSPDAIYILSRLEKRLITRLKYSGEKYWQICLNISEIAFVLYIHPDFKKETIENVIEGLDIGKVNSIEIEECNDSISKYQGKVMWEHANPVMWQKKMDIKYNTVKIRFDYWYRTKTTYSFQNSIYYNKFTDIPFEGSIWTFYQEEPKFDGINPFVWVNKEVDSVDL